MEKRLAAVDRNRDLILEAQKTIWDNPETGFREFQTSTYLEKQFEKLGYTLTRAGNIPGFYTILDTGRPGPEVMILGELDSLLCPEHPDANPGTGAVHCCGHNVQCAALLGVAAALKEPGVLENWSGRIRLCAVPAEETIEMEYRSSLKKQGIIHYMSGKAEFLYRGYFDGVDIAFMVHTTPGKNFEVKKGMIGMLSKQVTYKGVASHAGAAPWNGCNALYAAAQGLNAINALRETFKETDLIRVHPIMTAGGSVVNAIPDKVVLESFVRGRSLDAIKKTNQKVNRALCGAALSLGTNIEIQDIMGAAPLTNSEEMIQVVVDAATAFPDVPLKCIDETETGSSDMGILSCMMPVVHPYAPGAKGAPHSTKFFIRDPELACVTSAKLQVEMLNLLLENDAVRAKKIIESYTPLFPTKEAYFESVDALTCSGERIVYGEDCVTVKL